MNPIDIARGYYYEFFSTPLCFGDGRDFAQWKAQAQIIAQTPPDAGLGGDFDAMLGFDYADFKLEQNAVFYDLSYVNVPASASFYDEGRDDGRLKLVASEIIRKSGFRKDESCAQSEDEFGFAFAFCASALPSEPQAVERFFRFVLNPVIDEFAAKLATHKNSRFFAHFSRVMAAFFAQERIFLNVQPPQKPQGKSLADEALERLPYEPRLPARFSAAAEAAARANYANGGANSNLAGAGVGVGVGVGADGDTAAPQKESAGWWWRSKRKCRKFEFDGTNGAGVGCKGER